MFDSYSLKIIIAWLAKHGFTYRYHNTVSARCLVNDGLQIELDGDFSLSVQTNPLIACSAFAETGLMYKNELMYILDYEYDVLRHETPDDLFQHIMALKEEITGYVCHDTTITLASGQALEIK